MSDQYGCHCLCGRSFFGDGALALHQRSCKGSKRRIEGVLGNLTGLWDAKTKKRRKNNHDAACSSASESITQIPAFVNDLQVEDPPAAEKENEVGALILPGHKSESLKFESTSSSIPSYLNSTPHADQIKTRRVSGKVGVLQTRKTTQSVGTSNF